MAKAESYNDLIFQLGDLARERLVNKPNCPVSMQRVLRAEAALVARQEEIAALEQQMNEEDVAHQEWLAACTEERQGLKQTVKRHKKAVDAVEGKVKEFRKKSSTRKIDLRYGAAALEKEERRTADLQEVGADPAKIEIARQNLKKLRLAQMRMQREVEELERSLTELLTPKPGQPGGEGIVAHKRLVELEDEETSRQEEHGQLMEELDRAVAEKEQEVLAAEDYLDQALFLLGEECYVQRLADPALSVLYPRLDKAAS